MALMGWEWIAAVFVFIGILYIISRIIRASTKKAEPSTSVREIIKEKEIIKEVVMVPCSYCGGLMPQTSTFCPHCGAKRKP